MLDGKKRSRLCCECQKASERRRMGGGKRGGQEGWKRGSVTANVKYLEKKKNNASKSIKRVL